ncbi:MAG TPA: hypothetical protein VF192_10600 [Longimicrobiales bacterium]
MPIVRVAIWNIQNFGSTAPKYTVAKGNNSAVLARFIAQVVNTYDLDVLMIQEVLETAGPSLVNVRNALNAGLQQPWWCYDWIKGAFAADTPTPIQSPNDLAWNSGRSAGTRRAEGYAVFWRNDTTKFTMVPAEIPMSEGVSKDPNYNPPQPLPANCLSLSMYGRDVRAVHNRPQATAGFRPTHIRPTDFDYALYPDVSNMQRGSVFWGKVRRPAFCVLDLNDNNSQQADRLCPIVSYHAPSNRLISNWATYIAGLAEQLYLTQELDGNGRPIPDDYIYHGKVIAGGDFNLTPVSGSGMQRSQFNWNYYYGSFWKNFAATWDAGAQCGSLTTAASAKDTTVQVNQSQNGLPIGPPIMGDMMGDYLSQPIDNIFGRNLPNVRYGLGFLLRDLMFGPLDGDPIKVYYSHLDGIRRQYQKRPRRIDRDRGPIGPDGKPVFSFMQDWRKFLQGVRRGQFLDWRPAAEFVHGLVSDHMPVIAEMRW